MAREVGGINRFDRFGKRSNNWGERMNNNLIKTAVALQGSCISMTTPLPASANDGDVYINPDDLSINVWIEEYWSEDYGDQPGAWFRMPAAEGYTIFVVDQRAYYVFLPTGWTQVWDLDQQHRVVERELTLYNPYRIRRDAVIFRYCAGTEFTIPAGAPGSGATLEVAGSGALQFSIRHNNLQVGTIDFDAGQTSGTVNIASQVVVHPAASENMYVQAHTLTIVSPGDTFVAEGLAVSIKGAIRSIDQ